MAEDFVTRDQHRADLAELRLEIANSLASLDKWTELIAQELRSFQQQTQQNFTDVKTELRTGMQELRSEMRELRATTKNQMWTIIGVITSSILVGIIKLVFFP